MRLEIPKFQLGPGYPYNHPLVAPAMYTALMMFTLWYGRHWSPLPDDARNDDVKDVYRWLKLGRIYTRGGSRAREDCRLDEPDIENWRQKIGKLMAALKGGWSTQKDFGKSVSLFEAMDERASQRGAGPHFPVLSLLEFRAMRKESEDHLKQQQQQQVAEGDDDLKDEENEGCLGFVDQHDFFQMLDKQG